VIIALGNIYAQVGRRDEVRELMRGTQSQVREQPGCLSYEFAETLEEPGRFIVVQRWRDRAAIDEHYRSRAFADYQARVAELIVRISELDLHTVQETFRPLASAPVEPQVED
jgi:quinol monooxygenase YgiN